MRSSDCSLTTVGRVSLGNTLKYLKIPNKGCTSNKMCAPLLWRNKMNWKIMGVHHKVCANYSMCILYYLGSSADPSAVFLTANDFGSQLKTWAKLGTFTQSQTLLVPS